VTVSSVEPDGPAPRDAEMVALPAAIPVARPSLPLKFSTVAMDVSELT